MRLTVEVIGRTPGPILVVRLPRVVRRALSDEFWAACAETVMSHVESAERRGFPVAQATWTGRVLDQ